LFSIVRIFYFLFFIFYFLFFIWFIEEKHSMTNSKWQIANKK